MVREEDEYELIPMAPIRRLEKRLERIEESSTDSPRSIIGDIIDIVRMNQQLVDELAKSNDAMRIELSKLPGKLDELIMNLNQLISFIKTSGEAEVGGISEEALKPLVEKMDEMVKTNKAISEKNDSMLELFDEISKRLKGPPTKAMPMRQLLPMPGGPRPMPRTPMATPIAKPTTQTLRTTKPIKI